MPPYPGFVGPSYTSLSIIAAQERTVNFYVEQVESQYGKAKRVLYPTPGYVTRANASGGVTNLVGGIRQIYTSRVNFHGDPGTTDWFEACYAVVGSQLCMLGFITPDSSPVGYALGLRYYFYDLGSVEGLGLPIWTYRSETGPEVEVITNVWDGGVYPPPVFAYALDSSLVFNHATQTAATLLTVDFKSMDGVDATPLYLTARIGDGLLVQSEANPGLYHRYFVTGPVSPPIGSLPYPVYTDNFNRANGPLGPNWWTQTPNGVAIIGNQATFTVPDDKTTAYWNGTVIPEDQFSEVTYVGGPYTGPAVRMGADGYSFYSWRQERIYIQYDRWAITELTVVPGGPFVPGDRLRLEVEGSTYVTLRCYRNGVLVYTHNESGFQPENILRGGRPGMELMNYGTPQPKLDNWAGGQLQPKSFTIPVVYAYGPGVAIPSGSRTQISVEQIGLVSWQENWPSGGLFFSFTDANGADANAFYEKAKVGDTIELVDAENPANNEIHTITGPGGTWGGKAAGLHGQGFYLATDVEYETVPLRDKRLNIHLRSVIPFPAYGLVHWVPNTQQTATALWFDWRSDDNLDSTLMFQTAKLNDLITIQSEADPTNKLTYRVTGPAVGTPDGTTRSYYVPVVFVSATGAGVFPDDVRLKVALGEEVIGPPAGFEGDTWPAVITDNGDGGNQLAVSSGGFLWVWAEPFTAEGEGGGPVKVDGLSNIACCASLDGFIIALDVLNGILHSSVLYDALNFPGLAIDMRTSAPDAWRWMIVQNSLLYVMGERTTDVYYNAGLANFPFAKHTGGTIPFGIAAVQSAAVVGNGWMMLSRTAGGLGQVVFVFGQTAEVVSDHALDAAIEEYNRTTGIVDALGESFELLGHVFYLLTFPKANVSWLFDLQSKTWTEIASWDAAQGRFAAWKPHWHAVYQGRRLIGDRNNVLLYELDHTVATESGDWYLVAPPPAENEWKIATTPIHRQRRAPSLFSENKRIFFNGLELFMETGVGLTVPAGQLGYDPKVTLSYSNDGGHTFTEAAAKSGAGKAGQYRVRVSWNRLGAARDRVFQLDMSDPVPWRLIDATIDIRPGAGT